MESYQRAFYPKREVTHPLDQDAKSIACDLCQSLEYDTINDARIEYPPAGRAIWAFCCQPCFHALGGNYGIGQGQLIDVQSGEVLKGGSNDS